MTTTIITGASSGIGLATAQQLSRNGHKVYAGVRNPEASKELKDAMESSGGAIIALPLDVTDEISINSGVNRVLSENGQVDVLVNNAGIARGRSPEDTPLSWVREMFETNVYGLMAMTQAVLPSMRERRSGTIVQVSSMGGRTVAPGALYYSASKHAVEAYSEGLAGLVGIFGVRVAIIEPGFTATPILQKARAVQGQAEPNGPYEMHDRRSMKRVMNAFAKGDITPPDEVARAIERAIETTDPKLRYLVGKDALRTVEARHKLSDEEYLARFNIEDDEAFYDVMEDLYGQAPDR